VIDQTFYASLYWVPVWVTCGVLLVALIVSFELGHRSGLRTRLRRGEFQEVTTAMAAIHGAVLGLLGLLLAFTYSYAAGRADNRRAAVVQEANAIGTAYLRSDLVPEPARSQLQDLLRTYCGSRIIAKPIVDPSAAKEAIARAEGLHADIWKTAVAGIASKAPTPTDALVIAAMNDLIDMHGVRLAAARDRLPGIILIMLALVACISLALTGHSSGLSGRRNRSLNWALALTVSGVIYVTIDLDHPRAGFIQVSQASLEDALRGMQPATTTAPSGK
jgi:hypothetical protein